MECGIYILFTLPLSSENQEFGFVDWPRLISCLKWIFFIFSLISLGHNEFVGDHSKPKCWLYRLGTVHANDIHAHFALSKSSGGVQKYQKYAESNPVDIVRCK